MINLRYHIVSLTAVFLSLGLGIVLGSAVISGALVDRLESDISGARTARDKAQQTAESVAAQRDQSNDLVTALAPRVTESVLVGMRVVFIGDESNASWHAGVRDAIRKAGAVDGGTITLTAKWTLREVEQRDQLRRAVTPHTLGDRDPGADGAKLLGELLLDPGEQDVITKLVDAGFIRTAPGEGESEFAPATGPIVIFASPAGSRLADLARGAGTVTPTLVVAGSVDELGAVAAVRKMQDRPSQLATFDSAVDDPSNVGVVLTLRAAADGHGGHFGRGPGLKFLPPPS